MDGSRRRARSSRPQRRPAPGWPRGRRASAAAGLGLGARACLLGRSLFYGLALRGETGVRRWLELLREEFELALALLGCPSFAALDAHSSRGGAGVGARAAVAPAAGGG